MDAIDALATADTWEDAWGVYRALHPRRPREELAAELRSAALLILVADEVSLYLDAALSLRRLQAVSVRLAEETRTTTAAADVAQLGHAATRAILAEVRVREQILALRDRVEDRLDDLAHMTPAARLAELSARAARRGDWSSARAILATTHPGRALHAPEVLQRVEALAATQDRTERLQRLAAHAEATGDTLGALAADRALHEAQGTTETPAPDDAHLVELASRQPHLSRP